LDFYLGDLHFPVNPSEVTVVRGKQFETVNIINLGEVDLATGEKITEISFSSFFPGTYDPSYCRTPDLPDANSALLLIESWIAGDQHVHLKVTESELDLEMEVIVSSFQSQIMGGEPEDVYFDISLRAWREVQLTNYSTATATSTSSSAQAVSRRTDTKAVPKVYTVKPGDSLYKIARLLYGDGSKWQTLYQNNKTVIGNRPELIYPGTKLVIK
jgi:hypothetical protein